MLILGAAGWKKLKPYWGLDGSLKSASAPLLPPDFMNSFNSVSFLVVFFLSIDLAYINQLNPVSLITKKTCHRKQV